MALMLLYPLSGERWRSRHRWKLWDHSGPQDCVW